MWRFYFILFFFFSSEKKLCRVGRCASSQVSWFAILRVSGYHSRLEITGVPKPRGVRSHNGRMGMDEPLFLYWMGRSWIENVTTWVGGGQSRRVCYRDVTVKCTLEVCAA